MCVVCVIIFFFCECVNFFCGFYVYVYGAFMLCFYFVCVLVCVLKCMCFMDVVSEWVFLCVVCVNSCWCVCFCLVVFMYVYFAGLFVLFIFVCCRCVCMVCARDICL